MNSSTVPRARRALVLLALLVLVVLGMQSLSGSPARADSNPEYDSLPAVSPPSFVSLGYQATSTAEFGDHIQLAGTDRVLDTVSVGLTNWACESDYSLVGNVWVPAGGPCTSTPGSTFAHPITVNMYEVDTSGITPIKGALLATLTTTFDIPFRPSANPGIGPGLCGAGATQWYNPGTGTCQNGFATTVTFDFSTLGPTLPNELIVAVAYNTQTYGASPLGTAGPYNSLNVSLANAAPTVGTNVDNDVMFWNTLNAANYSDGGAGGVGTLRADTGWGAYFGLVLESRADAPAPSLAATGSSSGGLIPALLVMLIGGAGLLLVAGLRRGRTQLTRSG